MHTRLLLLQEVIILLSVNHLGERYWTGLWNICKSTECFGIKKGTLITSQHTIWNFIWFDCYFCVQTRQLFTSEKVDTCSHHTTLLLSCWREDAQTTKKLISDKVYWLQEDSTWIHFLIGEYDRDIQQKSVLYWVSSSGADLMHRHVQLFVSN